jgi:hypothetical protein
MAATPTQTSPDSFKLEQFGGMLPAWDSHLIPQGQAADSLNGYLFSGGLAGWRTPKLLYTFTNGASKFAYRLPTQTQNIANATLFFQLNAQAGDQLTLGEEVYTFVSTVTAASPAYAVQLGADAFGSATNLFAAFTHDNGAGTNAGILYGVGTVANPAINQNAIQTTNILAAAPARIQVFAPNSGAAYNATIVGETTNAVRLDWQYNGATTLSFAGGTNLAFDASITGASTWLEFVDPDTDVMRSPVVDDSFDRFYFASPSLAPEYNTRDRITAGQPAWLLGVPAPGCTPGVTVSGGGNTDQLGFVSTTSANQGAPGANTIYLIPITPQGAEILNDISFVTQTASATARYAGVLYSDLNGSPNTLLNTGTIGTGTAAGGTAASAFVNPTGLLANTQYWIGVMLDTAIGLQVADDAGSAGVVVLNTFSNGPPGIVTNLQVGFPDLQLWGDLTASSVLEARSYVYTYITAYGEESPPSPATVVTGWSNGVWTIELNTPPPDQMGVTRDITNIRLYRTLTATQGSTTYFQVINPATTTPVPGSNATGDMPVTTAVYVDTVTDDIVADNSQLASQLWSPPPEDLQGIIAMPNGMAVGWRANEIWFCEPYRPHAWPPSYVLTCVYPIVGLGVTGSSVVACTNGSPMIATGTSPGSMSSVKPQNTEPCHSRGSILGNNDGVYYAGPNGLILVTQYGSVTNTSELWITREKWQQLTPQKNLRSVFLVSSYFSMGCVRGGDNSVAQTGFTIELNAADAQSFTIWPQPGGHRLGFNRLNGPNGLDVFNVRIDTWSSVCLVMQGNGVYYYDFTDPVPTTQVYSWTSKLFQQKSKKNFAAMRCWFSIPPGTPALNPVPATNATLDPFWNSLPADRYGFIKVFSSGVLVTCREIRTPQALLRILSGFKGETWQFQIIARVPISNLQVGTSVKAMATT